MKHTSAFCNGCLFTHTQLWSQLLFLSSCAFLTLPLDFLSLPQSTSTHTLFVSERRQEKHQSCPVLREPGPVQHRRISLHPAVVSDSSRLISTPNHSKGTGSSIQNPAGSTGLLTSSLPPVWFTECSLSLSLSLPLQFMMSRAETLSCNNPESWRERVFISTSTYMFLCFCYPLR